MIPVGHMLRYAVAMWLGFALAQYLLPIMVTGSDFCRRGVHCNLSPSLHPPGALVGSVRDAASVGAASRTEGQRCRAPALMRIKRLRRVSSHLCRSVD